MKTNDASRDAARPLLSFNSFLIQEHLRRDERRDVFVRFQQEFDEKVSKLEAGVGFDKGGLLAQPVSLLPPD